MDIILENHSVIANLATTVTAIITAIGVVIAVLTYRSSRADERERARPYMFVDIRFNSTLCSFVIKNIGASPAHNIHTIVEPSIPMYLSPDRKLNDMKVLKNLSFLGPQGEISILVGNWKDQTGEIKQKFTVAFNYYDTKGRMYHNTQTIDPTEYSDHRQINRKDIHDVAKGLDDIAQLLRNQSGRYV